jgi:hypothetical protein
MVNRMRRLVLLITLLSAACAQPPVATPVANMPSEPVAQESDRMSMPQLVASRAAEADRALIKASCATNRGS